MTKSSEPALRLGKPDPAKTDPALLSDLKRNCYPSPEAHNAEIKRRFGPRAELLNRDEVIRLYGIEAALRLWPNP